MLPKKYKSTIVKITNPLPDIFSVTFTANKKFQYLPGQFLHLALDDFDGTSQWPESRCFSMQSSPNEETLKITYAVKGNFTKRMSQELHEGNEVWLKFPYGDLFTQSHSKVNTVFIAGGTGITPFLSLFTNESFNEYINPKIYLGFRTKEYNIYDDELQRLSEIRKNSCNSFTSSKFVKLFYQETEGIIDIKSIYNENSINSDYFISGPPAMIKTFKNYLINNGLPEQKVKTDEWE